MKIKTNVKAGGGGWLPNHNQGLRVKTKLKAGGGGWFPNHNQTLAS
jgi:hypothetical protein